ncbi:hypothetical protein ABZ869_17475 [Streptomyces sp. NPDC046928]|uniref:hypothetical protein n=1 Tax=Streptomyces sp. NPDC046928 TaxID=3155021 RepID=UPI00340FC1BE
MDLALQRLGRALQGAEGLDDAAVGLGGGNRRERLGQITRHGSREGQAAERVVHQVQLGPAGGQVGSGGVQQVRVGAVLGRGGGALRGQVLDGVLRGGRALPPGGGRAAGGQGAGGTGKASRSCRASLWRPECAAAV